MISNIYFQVSGLFYVALLIWTFFSKKRKNSAENNLLIYMTLIGMFSLILDVFNTYFVVNSGIVELVSVIISKFNLVLILLDIYLVSVYLYILSFNKSERLDVDREMHIKKMINDSIPLVIIAGILLFILPMKVELVNNVIYSSGLAVYLMDILVLVFVIICIYRFMARRNSIKSEQRKIILVLIGLLLLTFMIQVIYPELLIVHLMKIFMTVYVFFTIKSPDLEVLNELKEARDRVELANADKANVLLNISHEIRTPLNTIIGFSEALMEEDVSKSAKEDIKYIMMASNSLLETVNGILDDKAVDIQKLKIKEEKYDLNQVIKQVMAYVNNKLLDTNIEFKTKIDSHIPDVLYGDSIRVKQLMLNLLNNAIKYTEEGYIELDVEGILKGNIYRLIISVEDTGIGIPKEKINQIFSKYKKAEEDGEFSIDEDGSDLVITKKLVELMNGRISVISEEKEGSKFTIAIDQKIVSKPLKIENSKETKEENETFDISGKKILVVDDNNMNLKVAVRLLKHYNVIVDEADSGLSCLNKINEKEEYDLIFLDDLMPGMSGSETLKRLRKRSDFSIPVVVLTANVSAGMKDKYINDGFDDYIAKPIDRKELQRVLRKFLTRRD